MTDNNDSIIQSYVDSVDVNMDNLHQDNISIIESINNIESDMQMERHIAEYEEKRIIECRRYKLYKRGK